MKRYFLGVDGGQSSTTALIGDESGRVIGAGRGGPCNHVGESEGRQKFLSAVAGCLLEACVQAGCKPGEMRFAAACLGFSGGPKDKEELVRETIECDLLVVTHDALIGLVGATGGEPGLITIAGTGSMSFGRNGSGQTARAGGWGFIFGDEGGGFDLTRQALRAALSYEEGWGPATALHAMLLRGAGARDANELMHRFYTAEFPRARVAALSKLVDEAAIGGDRVAREILERAAQELAVQAGAVRSQLFAPGELARVSFVGGVFGSQFVLERFRLLMELEEGNRFGAPRYGPAEGALMEAYRIAGARIDRLAGV